MMFSNYHTHTTYCDGADTPEELVLEAIWFWRQSAWAARRSASPGIRI